MSTIAENTNQRIVTAINTAGAKTIRRAALTQAFVDSVMFHLSPDEAARIAEFMELTADQLALSDVESIADTARSVT